MCSFWRLLPFLFEVLSFSQDLWFVWEGRLACGKSLPRGLCLVRRGVLACLDGAVRDCVGLGMSMWLGGLVPDLWFGACELCGQGGGVTWVGELGTKSLQEE